MKNRGKKYLVYSTNRSTFDNKLAVSTATNGCILENLSHLRKNMHKIQATLVHFLPPPPSCSFGCSLLTQFAQRFTNNRNPNPILNSLASLDYLKGYYTATHRGVDEWSTHYRCWTPSPLIICVAITQSLSKGPFEVPWWSD